MKLPTGITNICYYYSNPRTCEILALELCTLAQTEPHVDARTMTCQEAVNLINRYQVVVRCYYLIII